MDDTEIRVLLTEDLAEFHDMINKMLRLAKPPVFSLDWAPDMQTCLEILSQGNHHIVLLDLHLPDSYGLETVVTVCKKFPSLPVVAITGHVDQELAQEILRSGAQDFFQKTELNPNLLSRIIKHAIERKHYETNLEQIADELEHRVANRTRQLQLAKSQWEATFDAVPDLIAITDQSQRVIRANQAMAKRVGMDTRSIVGQDFCGLMGPGNLLASDGRPDQGEPETPGQIKEIQADKLQGHFLVSSSPLQNQDGEIYASVHVARDIGDLKKAERKLQDQLEFVSTIVETIPNPMFIKNRNGVYTGCNTLFAEFLGLKCEDILGRTAFDFVPRESAELYFEKDEELFNKPGVLSYETQVPSAKNGLRDVVIYKAMYDQQSAEECGIVGVLIDITERKKIEEQLIRSQKLEAIGLLSAGIAHEINTPTQYIHTNVEYLSEVFADCYKLISKLFALKEVIQNNDSHQKLSSLLEDCMSQQDFGYLKEDVDDALHGTLEGIEPHYQNRGLHALFFPSWR